MAINFYLIFLCLLVTLKNCKEITISTSMNKNYFKSFYFLLKKSNINNMETR